MKKNKRKNWKTLTDQEKLNRKDNQMQCGTPRKIPEPKKGGI